MRFVHESVLPVPPQAVWDFHARADAFALLQPPWEKAEVLVPPQGLDVGTRVELRSRVGPFRIPVVAEHVACDPGRSFEDVMLRGPFARWHHKHQFLEHPDGCLLRDEIEYAPPLGWLGRLVDPLLVRPRLRRMFRYRHEVTRREVLRAQQA